MTHIHTHTHPSSTENGHIHDDSHSLRRVGIVIRTQTRFPNRIKKRPKRQMIDSLTKYFTSVLANTLVHSILDPQGCDQPETEQYLHCSHMPHIQTQRNAHMMSLVGSATVWNRTY